MGISTLVIFNANFNIRYFAVSTTKTSEICRQPQTCTRKPTQPFRCQKQRQKQLALMISSLQIPQFLPPFLQLDGAIFDVWVFVDTCISLNVLACYSPGHFLPINTNQRIRWGGERSGYLGYCVRGVKFFHGKLKVISLNWFAQAKYFYLNFVCHEKVGVGQLDESARLCETPTVVLEIH